MKLDFSNHNTSPHHLTAIDLLLNVSINNEDQEQIENINKLLKSKDNKQVSAATTG